MRRRALLLTARPTGASICHCRMCQKAGGAPFMAFAGVRHKHLVFTRGAPGDLPQFGRSPSAASAPLCGTPLTYRLIGRDRISVTIGSLDSPADVAPTEQIGVESALPWFAGLAALPDVADRELVEGDQTHGGWQPPASRPRLSTGSPDGETRIGAAADAPQGETA